MASSSERKGGVMKPKPKTRKQYKGTNYAGYLRGWNIVDAGIRKQKRSAPPTT